MWGDIRAFVLANVIFWSIILLGFLTNGLALVALLLAIVVFAIGSIGIALRHF